MRNVYVLGTGMIKFGRYPDKTVPQLGGAAALLALKDAGILIKDVEMFACGISSSPTRWSDRESCSRLARPESR